MDKVNAIEGHKQNRAFPEANDLSLDFLAMARRTYRANLSNADLGAFGLDDEAGDPADSANLIEGPSPFYALFHEGKPFIKRLNHLPLALPLFSVTSSLSVHRATRTCF